GGTGAPGRWRPPTGPSWPRGPRGRGRPDPAGSTRPQGGDAYRRDPLLLLPVVPRQTARTRRLHRPLLFFVLGAGGCGLRAGQVPRGRMRTPTPIRRCRRCVTLLRFAAAQRRRGPRALTPRLRRPASLTTPSDRPFRRRRRRCVLVRLGGLGGRAAHEIGQATCALLRGLALPRVAGVIAAGRGILSGLDRSVGSGRHGSQRLHLPLSLVLLFQPGAQVCVDLRDLPPDRLDYAVGCAALPPAHIGAPPCLRSRD